MSDPQMLYFAVNSQREKKVSRRKSGSIVLDIRWSGLQITEFYPGWGLKGPEMAPRKGNSGCAVRN